MCVIFVAREKRPDESMVERAYATNKAGAGIAWQEMRDIENDEGQNVPTRIVRWEKGLDEGKIQDLVKQAPLPFVCHFRIPTVGGERASLTHPFPISDDVALYTSGWTQGNVMFHNGHWNPWKDRVLDTAFKKVVEIPGGRWSDSRAMAWVAYHFGIGALEIIDEKSVAFGPDLYELFGGPWHLVNDILCSNTHWQHRGTVGQGWHQGSTGGGSTDTTKSPNATGGQTVAPVDPAPVKLVTPTVLGPRPANKGTAGGASPQETFRTSHRGLQGEADFDEDAEARVQAVRQLLGEGTQAQGQAQNEAARVHALAEDDTDTGPLMSVAGIGLDESDYPFVSEGPMMAAHRANLEAFEWAKDLNPKSERPRVICTNRGDFRHPLGPSLADAAVERERRLVASRKGIVSLGRM